MSAFQQTADGGDRTRLAIVLIVIAGIMVPFSDGVAKILGQTLPILQVAFLRYATQSLFLAPFVLRRYGLQAFRPAQPWAQVARSLLVVAAVLCFYRALKTQPLADVVAIFFFNPFMVTALSPWLLGERVGVWRWSAVVVGLIGTFVVIRPGFAEVDGGTLAAIGAGTAYGAFVLLTRRIRGRDPALITVFLTGLMATALLAIPVPLVWQAPPVDSIWLLILLGVFGTAFSLCVVLAYEYGDASLLAPFGYVEIIAAVGVGYLLFGDLPDVMTWLGILIIIGAGVTIALRERLRNAPPTAGLRVRR
ncbi:MAG: DMT family transporter [Pseudomonadota bacterium]